MTLPETLSRNMETDERLRYDEPADEGISYGGSRKLFRSVARNMGVELSEQEDYDWLVLMQLCMLLDHLADEEQTDITSALEAIYDGELRRDLNTDAQVRTHNYLHRQPPESREKLLGKAKKVQALLETQRTLQSADELVRQRQQEAIILAEILSLEQVGGSDNQARLKFNTWLKSWASVGYLLDSLLDLGSDYENHESLVRPSFSTRLAIAKPLMREAIVAVRETPVREIGKCALNGFNYLARNRRVTMTTND